MILKINSTRATHRILTSSYLCANELKYTSLPLFDITNNCWKFGQDLLNGCWDMGIGNIVICRPAGGLKLKCRAWRVQPYTPEYMSG